jgi:hypothetical protein
LSYETLEDDVTTLRPLSRLTALTRLRVLGGAYFSDAGKLDSLTAFASCRLLRELDLSELKLFAREIAALGQLASLEVLTFGGPMNNDADTLRSLSCLTALTRLRASEPQDSAMLASLSALTSLRDLAVGPIEGINFVHIARLTALTALACMVIGGTIVKDIPALARMPSLHSLTIAPARPPLREAALLALAQLPTVHHLDVQLTLLLLRVVHHLADRGCNLSVAAATQLVNTSRLKRLVLRVSEERLADMEDALAVLKAAPGLEFHCVVCRL